jgi:NO-binding membrane sensor protein with MHYT domain
MVVYCVARKQVPKLSNAVGSVLISIGVATAMYGGAPTGESKGTLFYWSIGVTILLSTLVTGALTGLQQEILFQKYGKHPDEVCYYNYILINLIKTIQHIWSDKTDEKR